MRGRARRDAGGGGAVVVGWVTTVTLALAGSVVERPVEWGRCVCRERAWTGGPLAESPDRETAYAAAAPASASATRMAPAAHRRARELVTREAYCDSGGCREFTSVLGCLRILWLWKS